MVGMLDPQTGWLVGVIISLVLGIGFALWKGAEVGLGAAVIISFLFPDWVEYDLFGMPFNIRTTTAVLALAAYAARYPWRIKSPLIPLDFAVAGLVVIHSISDIYHGLGEISALRAYGEWALPYVCGRYAIRRNDSPVIFGWLVCAVIVLLSVGAVAEMATKINVWEVAVGERTGQSSREAMRYGYHRSFGNTIHPIFFAMQLIVLLPWPIYMWKATDSVIGKAVCVLTILTALAGAISTISRSPVLAFLLIPALAIAVQYVWARWIAIIAAVAFGIFVMQDPISVAKDAAEVAGDRIKEVEIDGQMVPMSSGLTRVWLYRVYWPSLKNAGPIGYGSYATRDFPVDVPKMPRDPATLRAFRWVDNAYLLFGLRFGWIGIAALVIFLTTTIWTGITLRSDRYWSSMAVSSSAMFMTLSALLFTVWFSYDFGFEALWLAGILGGIRTEST